MSDDIDVEPAAEPQPGRLRIPRHGMAEQIDPPQRSGQGVGGRIGPQLRDIVDAVDVGVGDHPVDDRGIRGLPDAMEECGGGVMGQGAELGRVAGATHELNDVGRSPNGLVEIAHTSILRRS